MGFYELTISTLDVCYLTSALRRRIEHDSELMRKYPDLATQFKEGRDYSVEVLRRLEAQTTGKGANGAK